MALSTDKAQKSPESTKLKKMLSGLEEKTQRVSAFPLSPN